MLWPWHTETTIALLVSCLHLLFVTSGEVNYAAGPLKLFPIRIHCNSIQADSIKELKKETFWSPFFQSKDGEKQNNFFWQWKLAVNPTQRLLTPFKCTLKRWTCEQLLNNTHRRQSYISFHLEMCICYPDKCKSNFHSRLRCVFGVY